MNNSDNKKIFYINEKHASASRELAYLLQTLIKNTEKSWDEIIILCIGSDRVTGDSLGPLTGYLLSQYNLQNIFIYGTLSDPIHALNLEERLYKIKKRHPSALIVAIDASLGLKKHLGFITIGHGPLLPGSGVCKVLPEVGDISVTGIVNISGLFDQLLLQTTRLSRIMSLANSISQGINAAFAMVPDSNPKIHKIRNICP